MAINIDLSKPLTKEQIEDLESRLPLPLVEHYKAQAGVAEEKPAAKAAASKSSKDDLI